MGRPAPLNQRIVTLIAVVLPFMAFVTALIWLWGRGVTWSEISILAALYVVTGLGITVGYHRLFTHRSFKTIWPIKIGLAICGSMAVQGPLLNWVAMHRRHHQHSDAVDDPHSPQHHGSTVWGVLAGFWHAHIGWMFRADPAGLSRYVGDLRRDAALRAVSRLFPLWAALGLLLPAALNGWITGTLTGAALGLIWGGLVRIFLVHHVTWSINSVCHLWGAQPFRCGDESRNNFIFGVLGFGEGWHNNHHAFPTAARHGLRWWQLDVSYYLIRLMALMRLASCVRAPMPALVVARKNEPCVATGWRSSNLRQALPERT